MSVYMLLQVLTLLALLALGVYYRRRRLVLLVEPTRRRARGLLGVGGTLMLLLAWLLLRDLAATHGHVFAGGLTAILLSVVAAPMLVLVGTVMVVVAGRYSFDSVIKLLDTLTGEPRQRR